MTFVEHNNRKKANKFAEYVTGKPLREYLANKVKQYCGENISVFKVEYEESDTLDSDFRWVAPSKPIEKEEIDIDKVNAELDQMAIDHLEKHLASQLILIQFFNADIDLKSFITKCHKVLDDYLLAYNFMVGLE